MTNFVIKVTCCPMCNLASTKRIPFSYIWTRLFFYNDWPENINTYFRQHEHQIRYPKSKIINGKCSKKEGQGKLPRQLWFPIFFVTNIGKNLWASCLSIPTYVGTYVYSLADLAACSLRALLANFAHPISMSSFCVWCVFPLAHISAYHHPSILRWPSVFGNGGGRMATQFWHASV